jgi:hypothetical protein
MQLLQKKRKNHFCIETQVGGIRQILYREADLSAGRGPQQPETAPQSFGSADFAESPFSCSGIASLRPKQPAHSFAGIDPLSLAQTRPRMSQSGRPSKHPGGGDRDPDKRSCNDAAHGLSHEILLSM